MNYVQLITMGNSPLELNGWLAWNREMWNLEPQRVVYAPKGKDLPRLEGVIYLDRKGRVRMPPRNPYLPFRFISTGTIKPERLYHQWLDVCGFFADELVKRGIYGTISLPPGFIDGRPFQWRGFEVGLRYTFIARLPVDEQVLIKSVRKDINKAQEAGYYVKRSTDWESIVACLEETGEAKSFSHRTDASALRALEEFIGEDQFLNYVGFSKDGQPVCAHLRLCASNSVGIAWSQGTRRAELSSGVNRLTYIEGFKDLYKRGIKEVDFAGANIPAVAAAKAKWGFPLVPYMTIRASDFRNLARSIFYFGRSLLFRNKR